MNARPTHDREAGILQGLTPLLDTLFLLLFAVLSVREARTAEIPEQVRIQLPEVERETEGESEEREQLVVVTVDGDAGFRVGDTPVPGGLTDLDTAMDAARAGWLPAETAVEIRGDRSAPYGTVVALLQYLRLRGYARVEMLAEGARESTREWEDDR